MAHSRVRVHTLHKTGAVIIGIPSNAAIRGITTISNSPALLLEAEDNFVLDLARYTFHVFDLGTGEVAIAPDQSHYLGVATTGNRCWAVFQADA